MKEMGLGFAKVLGSVLLLDSIYLCIFGDSFRRLISSIQKSSFVLNVLPAAVCYLLLSFMIYKFVVRNKLSDMDAFALGLCTYGIFDFTNMAVFKNWSLSLAIIDMIWGGTLYLLVGKLVRI